MLQDQQVDLDGNMASMKQCKASQGVWKVIYDNEVVGYFLVYVDDMLFVAKTEWSLATMASFGKKTGNANMSAFSSMMEQPQIWLYKVWCFCQSP